MKNVLIIGASGNLAGHVIDLLVKQAAVNLTLFLRHKNKLSNKAFGKAHLIEGDALDYQKVKAAIQGQDLVYVNLAGDLEAMAKNIVKAMEETGVKRIIAISSIGIYATPLPAMLKPYRKLADIIEASGLDYTILRPTWFSNTDEVDYELTPKGEPEKGRVISQKSIAAFITEVIETPGQYRQQNLGINKPNS